jgi:hypothetical protein
MSKLTTNDTWKIGDPVKRYSDGLRGTIEEEISPNGSVWVKWEDSGLHTCINSMQVERP